MSAQTNAPVNDAHPEMNALGLAFPRWQDAVEAAIATDRLAVTGEVRGGQLIQFADASGATLNILAVEPFATFVGFDSVTKGFAHVHMVNDVLAYLDVIDPFGNSQAHITANLAQGPLLADLEVQQWQEVGITALGVAVQSFESAAAYEEKFGVFPAAIESAGADIVDNGSAATPTAEANFAARVMEAEFRTTALTGQSFMHVVMDGLFPFDLCLPAGFNGGELPVKDSILAGSAMLVANVAAPGGGGCGGCGGDCACGGH